MGSAPSLLGLSVFSVSKTIGTTYVQTVKYIFNGVNGVIPLFPCPQYALYQGYEVINNYNQQSKWKLWSSRKDSVYNLNYVEAFVTNFDECHKPFALNHLNILSISMTGFEWMVRWSSVQSIMTLNKCKTS